jgi:hypothetical protein
MVKMECGRETFSNWRAERGFLLSIYILLIFIGEIWIAVVFATTRKPGLSVTAQWRTWRLRGGKGNQGGGQRQGENCWTKF